MSEYYKGLIEVCERFIARTKYHLIDNGESNVPMITSDFEAMREVVEIAKDALSQPERPTEDSEECIIAGQCIEHKGELYIRLSDVEKCVDRFKKPERPKGR